MRVIVTLAETASAARSCSLRGDLLVVGCLAGVQAAEAFAVAGELEQRGAECVTRDVAGH